MPQDAVRSATLTSPIREPAVRRRLSAPAFRAFLDAASVLGLTTADAVRLLGDMPVAEYRRCEVDGPTSLDQDVLERISLVLGITRGIRSIFADDDAGLRWLRAPNVDQAFCGHSPLELMLRGPVADLYGVRAYLDAWCDAAGRA